MAKMARECGINANLLATWSRKRQRAQADVVDIQADPQAAAFIAVQMAPVVHEAVEPTPTCVADSSQS